ncbi:MAG: hypothetical protein KatS3mg110_3413 [Pirellulaceae bacterium]|nr:MAG: hypothetical protein KatS3mg110_3413 [Pirellulaceae bacterium]
MGGHECWLANNGAEAVSLHQTQSFDLILMDVEMPELDGFEAARRIRRSESHGMQRTPIVALTAHAVSGFREQCLAAGMDDYLTKPVEPDRLFALLNRIAERSEAELVSGAHI